MEKTIKDLNSKRRAVGNEILTAINNFQNEFDVCVTKVDLQHRNFMFDSRRATGIRICVEINEVE